MREYREQERRDKADTAIVQAARSRLRAELRKGKEYVRRAMIAEQYPWVFWALRIEPPYWRRRVSVAYRLPLHCWPRRATNRIIHLEPLKGRGHISKPEHQ